MTYSIEFQMISKDAASKRKSQVSKTREGNEFSV